MREPIDACEPAAAREAFIELMLLLGQRQPVAESLGRLVSLAHQVIRLAAGVSLMRLTDEGASHLASSGDVAEALDRAQRGRVDGPSSRAALTGEAVHVADLRRRAVWPDYARDAIGRGAVSCFAVPVPAPGVFAALTVYGGSTDGGFDVASRYLAARFAAYAASVPGELAALESTATECGGARDAARGPAHAAADPGTAAVDRGTVDRAIGVLMERHRLTADRALDALGRAALQRRATTVAVAAAILTGEGLDPRHLHPSALGREPKGATVIPMRGRLPRPRRPR